MESQASFNETNKGVRFDKLRFIGGSKVTLQIDVVHSLHYRLREATALVHERMHSHHGFHRVKYGSIDKTSYTQLLCCLYSFYRPFEREMGLGDLRSQWLGQDLDTLGLDASFREKILHCADIPRLQTPYRRLGALYVVAGSALGGRQLARGLGHLFPTDETSGRRFFLGHGAQTSAVWRDYLVLLAAAPPDPHTQTEIVDAAIDTFAVFERWASGWKDAANG